MNYSIILFNNRKQQKIVKNFVTIKRAKDFFSKKIDESKNIIFDKKTLNGLPCNYELAIVSNKKITNKPLYKRDNIGKTTKVELNREDKEIIEIHDYKLPELIYDIKNKTRIPLTKLIIKFLPKTGIKLLSKLNHKIVIQNESELYLFSLKSELDSDRFIDSVREFFLLENRSDIIIVKDCSIQQRKFLYEILMSNGYPIDTLYRKFTTHPESSKR